MKKADELVRGINTTCALDRYLDMRAQAGKLLSDGNDTDGEVLIEQAIRFRDENFTLYDYVALLGRSHNIHEKIWLSRKIKSMCLYMAAQREGTVDAECVTVIRKGDTAITLYSTKNGGIYGVGADLIEHVGPMLESDDDLHVSDFANFLIKGDGCGCEYALELYECPGISFMYEINLDQRTITATKGNWLDDYANPKIQNTYSMDRLVSVTKGVAEILWSLNLDFSKYEYFGGLLVIRHKKGDKGNSDSFLKGEWGKMNINIPNELGKMFGCAEDVSVFSASDIDRIVDLAIEDYANDED